MRIESSEHRFLEEFIGFMESPLDENCIIHTTPEEFWQSYELYVTEYTDRKLKAEDAKKRNVSILNYQKSSGNQQEMMNIGVSQSFNDISNAIETFVVQMVNEVSNYSKKIHAQLKSIKQALTEMSNVRNEVLEQNKREIETLIYRLKHFSKILAKVDSELTRREKYN